MQRQAIVTRRIDPARLDVVINEAALRRPVGGGAVMAAQCRHLLRLNHERSTVTVRDTKDAGHGPALVFTSGEWAAFAAGMADGEFARPWKTRTDLMIAARRR